MLKNSDNPRFSRDEQGQWWYRTLGPRKLPRIRASIRTCERCGQEFLAHARTRHWSSRSRGYYCGIQCANAAVKYELRGVRRGPDNRNWQGGRRRLSSGYIHVWAGDHPDRNKNNYIYEHRLVMEEILGRRLEPFEEVHHRNGIRDDNRPANLELWAKRQPPGQRVVDLLDYARWILDTYGDLEEKLP